MRIKRLLELISSYSFNLYYIKGKDMILSDFLSRQKHDDSNLHDIIPISFNMYNILYERYYSFRIDGQIFSKTSVTDKIQQNTGGSCLSQIFWEHENLSGLSIIWLIQLL